jgi:tetratricopeptide (TPR) repeat protein
VDFYLVNGFMYRSSLFLTAALVGTTVALVQPVAAAKSAAEVEVIAKAVTVEIKLKNKGSNGSGIIIQKQGDLYILVTNRHIICGKGDCSKIPVNEVFTLKLPDGQGYKVPNGSVKLLGSKDNTVDLAIIQFRSNRNYAVAKLATSGSLETGDEVYTAGFPSEQPGFTFGAGETIAVVNKRLTGDSGGYTIIYNALTLPGMSGGGVFNSSGQLVAIHGRGDRYKESTLIGSSNIRYEVGSKIGYNRGIPVYWLLQNLGEVGIELGTDRSISGIRVSRSQVPATADEYFISGFNKFIDPGDSVVAGKQQSIQSFTQAIRLNPKYWYAYFMRALASHQVQNFQQSLNDYNQVLLANPRDYATYFNRGNLKYTKLNDIQGAMADFDQAIIINPKGSEAYASRAHLKYTKLNDIQGSMADFDQAIIINPKYAEAYTNRAYLKDEKLNDIQGSLVDYNQAIVINPKYAVAYYNRAILKKNKLDDVPGAMADFNQAIIINSKYAEAYFSRAGLKYIKLKDRAGAIQDLRKAAQLFRVQGNAQELQQAIKILKMMGATE